MSTGMVWFYCCKGCGNKTWTEVKARHVSCTRCKAHMTVEQMPIDQARALMATPSGSKPPVRKATPGEALKARTPRVTRPAPDPATPVPAQRAKTETINTPKVEPAPSKIIPCTPPAEPTPPTKNTCSKRGAFEATNPAPAAPLAPAKAEGGSVKANPKVVQTTLFDDPGNDPVVQEPVRSQQAG